MFCICLLQEELLNDGDVHQSDWGGDMPLGNSWPLMNSVYKWSQKFQIKREHFHADLALSCLILSCTCTIRWWHRNIWWPSVSEKPHLLIAREVICILLWKLETSIMTGGPGTLVGLVRQRRSCGTDDRAPRFIWIWNRTGILPQIISFLLYCRAGGIWRSLTAALKSKLQRRTLTAASSLEEVQTSTTWFAFRFGGNWGQFWLCKFFPARFGR